MATEADKQVPKPVATEADKQVPKPVATETVEQVPKPVSSYCTSMEAQNLIVAFNAVTVN